MSDKDEKLFAWESDQQGGIRVRSAKDNAKVTIKEMLRREHPGTDLPVRGNFLPFVKETDPNWMQYRVVHDACVDVLELWEEEDLVRYIDICDAVAKGVALLSYEEKEWVAEKKSWKVLIRWLSRVVEPPKNDMFA